MPSSASVWPLGRGVKRATAASGGGGDDRPVALPAVLKAFAGGRLFGEVSGGGPPWVLALPGWARTHADFGAVLSGIDAVALDLPGFGASPPPPAPWGSADYAAIVAEVLAEMADRVVVVGHSFGGRVAVHLAADYPDRVAALVLTGAPLIRPAGAASPKPALPFRVARAMHKVGLVSAARMEEMRRRYGSADYRAAQGVMRGVLVAALKESYDDVLTRVRAPVELVWGDNDTAAPLTAAEALRDRLPHAELVVLPGAGHLTPTTAPDALRTAIERHRP